jgi:hypothetical protein
MLAHLVFAHLKECQMFRTIWEGIYLEQVETRIAVLISYYQLGDGDNSSGLFDW